MQLIVCVWIPARIIGEGRAECNVTVAHRKVVCRFNIKYYIRCDRKAVAGETVRCGNVSSASRRRHWQVDGPEREAREAIINDFSPRRNREPVRYFGDQIEVEAVNSRCRAVLEKRGSSSKYIDLQILIVVIESGEIDSNTIIEEIGLEADFVRIENFRFHRFCPGTSGRNSRIDTALKTAIGGNVGHHVIRKLMIECETPSRLLKGSRSIRLANDPALRLER